MAFIATPRVTRDDFDAARVPGFREATRSSYKDFLRDMDSDMSAAVDGQGRFLAAVANVRDCPLCGSPQAQAKHLFDKLGMRIVECPGCSLVYSATVLEKNYDHDRYKTSKAQASFEAIKRNEAYASLERVKSRYIAQRLGDLHPAAGTFLDIGPGAGRLLDAAREAGWKTSGVELSPEFARICREAGHAIVEGLFPDDLPDSTRFDAVAMLDVLEHLHHPVEALVSVRSHLPADGVLAIQVPNVDSLLIRLEGAASLNFCHGHVNHFTRSTLRRVAEAAGLRTLGVETIISEIDRIQAFPAEHIAAVSREVSGLTPPEGFDADWLHAHGMGYKLLGFFAPGVR